ncbi:tail fibers protein [Salmonella phage SE4]|uniref:tail fiber assembly protein n=1 Tax=Salmonella phage SE4 TaxID=2575328 RepID=UPI0011D2D067|nr:tail fiber assembly protein [Salmonella phage SE4]QEG07761.1 tail fibers protein [Salmonella phage SE4]
MELAQFNNFTEYRPQRTAVNLAKFKAGCTFIKDVGGNDWYEVVRLIARQYKDAWFITVDEYNVVVAATKLPGQMFPVNASVYVVDEIPDVKNFSEVCFQWLYVNGNFILHADKLKEEAKLRLATEREWVDSEIEKEEDPTRRVLLSKYRAAVTVLDLSVAPHIDWPERP